MSEQPEKIGKYEVAGVLGQGAMGKVYDARDPSIGRRVAIKVIARHLLSDPSFTERLRSEARSAGRLSHPNILTIYELGEENGVPYVVMEFLPGKDLRDVIRKRQPLRLARKLDIAAQIARGLQYAHERHVFHRDVKPGNIRLLDDDRVKIMDFGVAKLRTGPELTQPGTIVGTAQYLSPEQIRGTQIDHRSDIFSFGALLYEMLSYQKPFEGDNFEQIAYKIVHEPPAPLVAHDNVELPAALTALVRECLEKDVRDRFSDLAPVVRGLEAVREQLEDSAAGSRVTMLLESAAQLRAEGQFDEAAAVLDDAEAAGTPAVERLRAQLERDKAAHLALTEAEELLAAGRHDDALERCRAVLAEDPESTAVKRFVEHIQRELVQVQRRRTESERIGKLLQAGKDLLEVRQLQQARDCFDQVLAIDPEHNEATTLKEQCETVAEQLTHVAGLLDRARASIESHSFDVAQKSIEQIEVLEPGHLEAAELARQLERWREAQRVYKRAETAIGVGDWQGARSRLVEVQGLEPRYPGVPEQLARVEAALMAAEAVREGQRLLRHGDLDGAGAKAAAVLEEDPAHGAAQSLLSEVERRRAGDGTATRTRTRTQMGAQLDRTMVDESAALGEQTIADGPQSPGTDTETTSARHLAPPVDLAPPARPLAEAARSRPESTPTSRAGRGQGGGWLRAAVLLVLLGVAGVAVGRFLAARSERPATGTLTDVTPADPSALAEHPPEQTGDAAPPPAAEESAESLTPATAEQDEDPDPALSDAALEGRRAAADQRRLALEAGAEEFAKELLERAELAAALAAEHLDAGRFELATAAYETTSLAYQSAAGAAEQARSAARAQERARALERELAAKERAARTAPPEPQRRQRTPTAAPKVDQALVERVQTLDTEVTEAAAGLDATFRGYDQAAAARARAQAALGAKDYTGAETAYREALSLMAGARRARAQRLEAINGLVAGFAAAFEARSVDDISAVVDISPEERGQWFKFFEVAREVDADIRASEFVHSLNDTRMKLAIQITYRDAQKRQVSNDFVRGMRAVERGGGWKLVPIE